MKWFNLLLTGMILVFSGVCEAVELREFTTKDGESIFGEIRDYNKETDVLQLYTDGGKRKQIKAATLRDEDFIYVRDWDAARKFEKNTDFRLYLDDPVTKNEWAKYRYLPRYGKLEWAKTHETYFDRIYYPIRFNNVTGYDLENVEFEYCIFYRQERFDWATEEKVSEIKVRPCLQQFAIIPNDANEKMESRSIVLRRKEILGYDRFYCLEGDRRRIRSELVGMIFRATLNTRSGITVTRERRVPDDLSEEYAWVEPSEDNMVWPDDDLDEANETSQPPTMFERMGGTDDEDG